MPCGISFTAPRVCVTFTLYTHQISVGFSLSRNQQLQKSAFTEESQLNIVLGRFHSNKTGLNLDCQSEKTLKLEFHNKGILLKNWDKGGGFGFVNVSVTSDRGRPRAAFDALNAMNEE